MAASGRKLGVAVLGLGRMGTIHTKNLLASGRAQVHWLMRNNVAEAQKFADNLDQSPRCVSPRDLDTILGDDRVDGIVISSSTSEHEVQIKAALEAGKFVFSEKPITAELSSTQQCYELAERKQKPLICAFHRRFDPSFYSVRQDVQAQTQGRLRLLRVSSHDLSEPPISYVKTSGGIFKDSTIHDLDMALWMTGSPAKKVYVTGNAFNPEIGAVGDLDLVVVNIEHQNGAISVIDNGRKCAHGYDQRLEAICEEGSYVVTNRPVDQVIRHSSTSSASPAMDQIFDTRYREAYVNEIEHFLDVMEGRATSRVSKSDVISAMRLAEAATESAKTGKPVQLS